MARWCSEMRHLIALLVALFIIETSAVFPNERYHYDHVENPIQRDTHAEPCECMLVQVHALYPNASDAKEDMNGGWRCVVGSHQVYSLEGEGLPKDFVQSYNLSARDSAQSYLSISAANLVKVDGEKPLFGRSNTESGGNKIEISPNATIALTREKRRALMPTSVVPPDLPTGDKTLLVVRVIDSDGNAPSLSASETSTAVFSDAVNLVRSIAISLSPFVRDQAQRVVLVMYLPLASNITLTCLCFYFNCTEIAIHCLFGR